jgi:hypothetical protein
MDFHEMPIDFNTWIPDLILTGNAVAAGHPGATMKTTV